jgi:hypothetical protein
MSSMSHRINMCEQHSRLLIRDPTNMRPNMNSPPGIPNRSLKHNDLHLVVLPILLLHPNDIHVRILQRVVINTILLYDLILTFGCLHFQLLLCRRRRRW